MLLISLLCTQTNGEINCEYSGRIKHIDWNILMNSENNEFDIPKFNLSINIDQLSIIFDIDLEYVGKSTDSSIFINNNNNEYSLGTTYVIGFDSFSVSDKRINKPSNCENRISSSFDNISDFNKFWTYSQYPYLQNNLASNDNLAYPPTSQYWILSINDNRCTPIHYKGIFSWNDLIGCTDFYNNSLIEIVDTHETITLSTTLFVELVSPFSMGINDTGYYRIYPLIKQDFKISIKKQINLLSSQQDIDLFIITIIAIYINLNNQFIVNIFIQSADYMILTAPELLSTPFDDALRMFELDYNISTHQFLCDQLYQIIIPEATTKITKQCPGLDFTGTYSMGFTAICTDDNVVCNNFINDNNGDKVVLSVDSDFIDNSCYQSMYNQTFKSVISLYKDDEFLEEMYFAKITDRIYVEVEIIDNSTNNNTGNWTLGSIIVDNIFLCIINDTHSNITIVDQQTGFGGCLWNDMINNVQIITNLLQNNDFQIVSNNGQDNIARFTFIPRDDLKGRLLIQIQLTTKLRRIDSNSRRRNLLQDERLETDQIRHFMTSIKIIDHDEDISDDTIKENSNNKNNDVFELVLICIGCGIVIIIIVVFICYKKRSHQRVETSDNTTKEQMPAIKHKHMVIDSYTYVYNNNTPTIDNDGEKWE